MKCEDIKKYISPYLDNEIDTFNSVEIEQHLEQCADCRLYFESQHKLEQSIKSQLTVNESTSAQWESALQSFEKKQRPSRKWVPVAASVCAVLLVVISVFLFQMKPNDMALAAVKNHNKYLANKMSLEYFSQLPVEVEQYFSDKLSFAVALPMAHAADNINFVGARLCHLKEKPVAFLVYSIDDIPVSVFISGGSQQPDQSNYQNYQDKNVVMSSTKAHTVIAVSKVSMDKLQSFIQAFK